MDIKMKLWTRPDSYWGAEWHDFYVFLSQHRDSDSLTRSNFTCALDKLGESKSCQWGETVQVVRENHWAVGWVEWIAIHKSDLSADQAIQCRHLIGCLSDHAPKFQGIFDIRFSCLTPDRF